MKYEDRDLYGLGCKRDEAEIDDACPCFYLALKEAENSRYTSCWLFVIVESSTQVLGLSRDLAVMETKGPLCSVVWSVLAMCPVY